jgi:hypothetical protein
MDPTPVNVSRQRAIQDTRVLPLWRELSENNRNRASLGQEELLGPRNRHLRATVYAVGFSPDGKVHAPASSPRASQFGKVVRDISSAEFASGLPYITVSRASKLQGLMFDAPLKDAEFTVTLHPEVSKLHDS